LNGGHARADSLTPAVRKTILVAGENIPVRQTAQGWGLFSLASYNKDLSDLAVAQLLSGNVASQPFSTKQFSPASKYPSSDVFR